jgi:eukaryotic-like serine/threonine-protein kinase
MNLDYHAIGLQCTLPVSMGVTLDIEERSRARVGSVVSGKWRLDALLGVGGMAAVYAATHRNKKRAAVKMLHRELSVEETLRRRFLREGYVANSVGHRGAVRVDDDDVDEDGSVYLVMELLEGETIEARCERLGGRLPNEEVLWIAHELLETLIAAHAAGILHRDLKPENLFLTREGALKVLDFCIARLREPGTSTTQSGEVLGTPSFMAPEQASGRPDDVDARTDVWAVGAVMFVLLSGREVHEATSLTDALIKAVSEPAPPIRSLVENLPPTVGAIVDRALAIERDQRFASAADMRDAVAAAFRELTGKGVTEAPPIRGELSPPRIQAHNDTAAAVTSPASIPMRSSRVPLVALAVALAAAIGLGGVLWPTEQEPEVAPATSTTPPTPIAQASAPTLAPPAAAAPSTSATVSAVAPVPARRGAPKPPPSAAPAASSADPYARRR